MRDMTGDLIGLVPPPEESKPTVEPLRACSAPAPGYSIRWRHWRTRSAPRHPWRCGDRPIMATCARGRCRPTARHSFLTGDQYIRVMDAWPAPWKVNQEEQEKRTGVE